MSHELKPEQQEQLIRQRLDGLRAERFGYQLDITRWQAIPEAMRDGSEQEGIALAQRAVDVLEAQIDALAALNR